VADETWQPKSDGPYDFRTEGPLAYYYHVEPLGYSWDTAPLPPKYVLERWLRFDPFGFQTYWPRWYELAEAGRWDELYPAPPPTPPPEVVVGPILAPALKPVYAPTPPPVSASNQSTVPTMAADAYNTPVDGGTDLPPWLKALLDTGERVYATVAGLESAKAKAKQEAVAFEGRDDAPVAQRPQGFSARTQQLLLLAGVAISGFAIWAIISRR
jgi:hypothetical protein